MKERTVYEQGFAVSTKCVGCKFVQSIIDSAVRDMVPHQARQRETIRQHSLRDVSTDTLWVFPDAQTELANMLAEPGIAIKHVFERAQNDIDNLSRNCPGM